MARSRLRVNWVNASRGRVLTGVGVVDFAVLVAAIVVVERRAVPDAVGTAGQALAAISFFGCAFVVIAIVDNRDRIPWSSVRPSWSRLLLIAALIGTCSWVQARFGADATVPAGNPERHDGAFVLNNHGSLIPVTEAMFRHAQKQGFLFSAVPVMWAVAIATSLGLILLPRTRTARLARSR